jgi:hypothetical protein
VTVEENLRLMKTLDDAWNSQDWDTFKKRHAENVAVYWPGQPEPTIGRSVHHKEAELIRDVGFDPVDARPLRIARLHRAVRAARRRARVRGERGAGTGAPVRTIWQEVSLPVVPPSRNNSEAQTWK